MTVLNTGFPRFRSFTQPLARLAAHLHLPLAEGEERVDFATTQPATVAPSPTPSLSLPPSHQTGLVLSPLQALHTIVEMKGPGGPVSSVPRAILPNGRSIPPENYEGGFHGTTEISPEVAMRDGLPARGDDWRLLEHAEQRSHSAFRGTTLFPTDPSGENGAAYWAGEGGWVYEIRGVPTWDVNALLDGRVKSPDGHWSGNQMRGENERAIPARVPVEHIKRFGRVESDPSGHLCVHHWIDNPAYHPR